MLVALLLVSWRLSSGPVSIAFLTPYMKAALEDANQGAFDISVGDTILTWAGWKRALDIRVVNVQSKLPSGDVVATIPEVSISLSVKALLKGVVAPRSIEFLGPRFTVQRDKDGHFALGLDNTTQGSDNFVNSMLIVMLEKPDPLRPLSYLKYVSVEKGEITYEDKTLDTTWFSPSATAKFMRVEDGLEAQLDLDVLVGDNLSTVTVEGTYSASGKRTDLGVSFDGITPSEFSTMSDHLKILSALDLPLAGTLTLSVQENGQVEGIGFDLTGTRGHVALPVALAESMGTLGWAQRIAVSDVALSGRYEGAKDLLDISQFNLTAQPGETVYLPAPLDHKLPIDTLTARLTYLGTSGQLDVEDLTFGFGKAFGGLQASVSGIVITDFLGGLTVNAKGLAKNVRYDDLPKLWPKDLGVDVRNWVLESLTKGVADTAALDVSLDVDAEKAVQVRTLSGEITSHGLEVNYISTMPRVHNARGHASFNLDRFDITIDSGTSDGDLKINSGTVALVKLQEDMQWAEIKLDIDGPVTSGLKLIDSEPLRFASDLGLKPETAQGKARANVSLRIPLKNDLLATEVEAVVSAKLTEAGIQGVVFDKSISQGELDLVVNNDGLTVGGKALLGEVPVQMKWNHDFRPNALFTDRYEVSGYIENVLNLGSLGLEVPDILSRYMQGGAEVNINHTKLNNGRQSLSARLDLANVVLVAPEFGWEKASGVPGTAVLEMRIDQDVLSEIPKFSVEAPDMDVSGSVSFLKDGTLERVSLDTMRSNLTDVAGSITPLDDGTWEVVLRGESLDARVLWDELLGKGKAEPAAKPSSEATDTPAADTSHDSKLFVNAAVDIRSVLISKGHVVHDLIGTVYRDRGLWRKLDISGVVGKNGTVELMLDTATDGLRYLSISSDDAGATLKTLGLHDNILGGEFDLKAAYTNPGKDTPLEGVVKVHDYAMIEAPTFAKLIGVMSLTGILDALQGDGLNFDILEAPFKLENGVLNLTQARASGPTIGVTASGTVDMGNQVLDLQGTVVPAYAINALLGKIPLIGKLFTGGEAGGGLFAATYTMKGQGENVDVSVNPLSVLAPGVLRNIFTGTPKVDEIQTAPQPAPQPQP